MAENNHVVVGVVAKHTHSIAGKLTQKVIDWLREREIEFRVDERTAENLTLKHVPIDATVPRKELTRQCSPIVVMGGDGTLISVCHHPAERPPVIVGVNLGTLGFLTEITTQELFASLEKVLAGKADLERRFLLEAEVETGSGKPEKVMATNDVVITKKAIARIFTIDAYVDGEFAASSRGDGIIVSTPGGSTAYSLAAGGSIVHPRVNALALTPICPHSLTIRPLILPGNSKICLKIAQETNAEEVYLTIDGQEGHPLHPGDRVTLTTSNYSFLFVRSPSKTYYQILGTKLKWASG